MRPVRLEMDGFASFRTATVVDFEGADYFALVGPTGSGKSTVIDAMVFALFGTAPRWDRANAVRYALAPTATRGTVRLVFDIGTDRYQIAREVRRYGQTIQQKSAALERFLTPSNATASTDEVEVIASEVSSVTPEVEKLLGLTFEEFTKAVVLPQGRFAEFLSAKASQRQEILLKLLGAHQYDLIMQSAGKRRSDAALDRAAIEARMEGLGHATAEAEAASQARLADLTELAGEVAALLKELQMSRAAVEHAEQEVATVEKEIGALATVRLPDGLDQLEQRAQSIATELDRARQHEAASAKAYAQARTALEGAGNRTQLERLRDDWAELTSTAEQLPELQQAASTAEELLKERRQAQATTQQSWSHAVKQQADAHQALQKAGELVANLDAERSAITAIVMPGGVADLAQRLDRARAEVERASTGVAAAEAAHDDAQAVLDELGDDSDLKLRLGKLDRFERVQADIQQLSDSRRDIEADQQDLQQKAADAVAEIERLQAAVDAASVRVTAADLRQHLTVGDHCPVCEQVISTLPPAVDPGETAVLQKHLKEAQQAERKVNTQLNGISADLVATTRQLSTHEAELAELRAELAAHDEFEPASLRDELETAVAAVSAAKQEVTSTRLALAGRRQLHGEAQQKQIKLQQERDDAWQTLRHQRNSVLAFGAPTQEPKSIGQAWQELTAWSVVHLDDLDTNRLPEAQTGLTAAKQRHQTISQELADATSARNDAQTALADATAQEAKQTAALKQAEARLEQLGTKLATAPTAVEVAEQLTALDMLEQAEQDALEGHREAITARETAEQEHHTLTEETQQLQQALRSARDPLVQFGAPVLSEGNLPEAWRHLTDWAAEACISAKARLSEQAARRQAAVAVVESAEQRLVDTAAEHQIVVATASEVEAGIASAQAIADREVAAVRRARQDLAELEKQHRAVQERVDVAGMLAEHLNARKFQRWLASAALDVLVEAASDSLFELSGKQFGLAHENGDFFVIDYADAEAKRSIRTLSGGETFQASLALALALSQEFSSLSSAAVTLDSIFLDEGFGSLDPDSLETVALTLERLAQGDRMVGIVTHVQGLAERIPTRFVVSRNSRTSTVSREG